MTDEPNRGRWPMRVVVLAVALLVATALGAVRVTALVSRPDPMTLRVGDAHFGVTHVEQVTGLTDEDMSGMGHGIQGLVRDDKTMIRVWLRISAGDRRTAFDAGRLRLYTSATAGGLQPLGGSVGRGVLHGHASIEGAVSFVVPRNGADLHLGALGTTIRLPLTHVDRAPRGAGGMDMGMGSSRGSGHRAGHGSATPYHPSPSTRP